MADIDFTVPLADLDGAPIPRDDTGSGKPLTLGVAAAFALCSIDQAYQSLSGEEKFQRGMLAMKVRENEAASLSVEEVALIKKVIASTYNPLVVARAWPLLDASLPKP